MQGLLDTFIVHALCSQTTCYSLFFKDLLLKQVDLGNVLGHPLHSLTPTLMQAAVGVALSVVGESDGQAAMSS